MPRHLDLEASGSLSSQPEFNIPPNSAIESRELEEYLSRSRAEADVSETQTNRTQANWTQVSSEAYNIAVRLHQSKSPQSSRSNRTRTKSPQSSRSHQLRSKSPENSSRSHQTRSRSPRSSRYQPTRSKSRRDGNFKFTIQQDDQATEMAEMASRTLIPKVLQDGQEEISSVPLFISEFPVFSIDVGTRKGSKRVQGLNKFQFGIGLYFRIQTPIAWYHKVKYRYHMIGFSEDDAKPLDVIWAGAINAHGKRGEIASAYNAVNYTDRDWHPKATAFLQDIKTNKPHQQVRATKQLVLQVGPLSENIAFELRYQGHDSDAQAGCIAEYSMAVAPGENANVMI